MMTTSAPKAMPAIINPVTREFDDFPSFSSEWCLIGGVPGGGGGAGPVFQEFPPVLCN